VLHGMEGWQQTSGDAGKPAHKKVKLRRFRGAHDLTILTAVGRGPGTFICIGERSAKSPGERCLVLRWQILFCED
jgi:hypothetical protein